MSSIEMMDDSTLDLLERKMADLERLVCGQNAEMFDDDDEASVADSLLNANTLLNAASNSHSNVEESFRRLRELDNDLSDDEYGEPDSEFDSKLSVILALHDQYKENIAALENIKTMDKELDQGHLKCLDELQYHMSELNNAFSDLADHFESGNMTEELVTSWQDVFVEVSKGLLAANTAVSQMEL